MLSKKKRTAVSVGGVAGTLPGQLSFDGAMRRCPAAINVVWNVAGAAPVVRGEAINTATTYGYDSVTMMQETKTTVCNVEKA